MEFVTKVVNQFLQGNLLSALWRSFAYAYSFEEESCKELKSAIGFFFNRVFDLDREKPEHNRSTINQFLTTKKFVPIVDADWWLQTNDARWPAWTVGPLVDPDALEIQRLAKEYERYKAR